VKGEGEAGGAPEASQKHSEPKGRTRTFLRFRW
jgi:hypothetical protein